MTLSVAERQARRREKLKAKGRVLFQAWVTPAQAKVMALQVKALLAPDGAGVTYHAPAPSETESQAQGPVRAPASSGASTRAPAKLAGSEAGPKGRLLGAPRMERQVRRREKPKVKGRMSRPFVPLAQLKGLSKETLAFLEKKEIKTLVKRIDTPEAERQARRRLSKRTEVQP